MAASRICDIGSCRLAARITDNFSCGLAESTHRRSQSAPDHQMDQVSVDPITLLQSLLISALLY